MCYKDVSQYVAVKSDEDFVVVAIALIILMLLIKKFIFKDHINYRNKGLESRNRDNRRNPRELMKCTHYIYVSRAYKVTHSNLQI